MSDVAGHRSRIRVVVVDDQGVIRTGLRMIVDNEPDMIVVGEARDGRSAVEAARSCVPDVVLMDIRMPHMDGIEATRRIMAPAPHRVGAASRTGVLVLTTFDDDEYVLGALRAGAAGFLLKDSGADALVQAIRSVHRGDCLIDPSVTRTLVARCLELETRHTPRPARGPALAELRSRLSQLSEREGEILVGLARGLSNREIAERLVVGETTVKTHVSHVLAKLGLSSRVQAVVFAYETGVVTPGSGSL